MVSSEGFYSLHCMELKTFSENGLESKAKAG